MTNRYSNGKIYRIVNSVNDDEYIGSTTTPLYKRWGHHKDDARKRPTHALYAAMHQYGFDKFRIILIENYPCSSKDELNAREQNHIDTLKMQGFSLYNYQRAYTGLPTGLNQKEYKSQYRQQYLTEIKEYDKQYRTKNNERINAFKRQKINCECGGHHNRSAKSHHIQSKKHQLYMQFGGLNRINVD